jgi:hypothetical protein
MTEITGGEAGIHPVGARCLVCLRTDHAASLAIPAEMLARFFEVYSGPAKPTTRR